LIKSNSFERKSGVEFISGYKNFALLFEHAPNFDDAEVVEMHLNRGNTLECARSGSWERHKSPTLKVLFYMFDNSYAIDDPKANANFVEFEFVDIQKLELNSFAHQNPITNFSITNSYNENLKKNMLSISWGGCGHEVSFICEKAAYMRNL